MERITIDNLPIGTKALLEKAAKKNKLLKINTKPNVMAMARKLILEGVKK